LAWQPLHENHSIESVSASVNFAEPLTEIIWRKAVREVEAKAGAMGLSERDAVNAFQIAIGANAIGLASPSIDIGQIGLPSQIESVRIARSHIDEASGQKRAAESISIGRQVITYQSTTYTRWAAYSERLNELFGAALDVSLGAVRPAVLRLEYKDSFRFDGAGEPLVSGFLKDVSPLIAKHVFDKTDLWHSHTGFFEKSDRSDQRLIQINLDANNVVHVAQRETARLVNIMTAVQENFHAWPEDKEITAGELLGIFESMHQRCTEVFREVVSPETAKRIGLT